MEWRGQGDLLGYYFWARNFRHLKYEVDIADGGGEV